MNTQQLWKNQGISKFFFIFSLLIPLLFCFDVLQFYFQWFSGKKQITMIFQTEKNQTKQKHLQKFTTIYDWAEHLND